MTRKAEWPYVAVIFGLLVTLLVCIMLLAVPIYKNNAEKMEIEVVKQDYQRQLASTDRKYESKINNLQEQINTLQFVSNKRYDLMDDDVKRNKRDIDDLSERVKPRKQ